MTKEQWLVYLWSIYPLEKYRIKPKEPKFKVGDWVVHPDVDIPWKISQNSIDHLDNSELKLWQPQPGEWCWVFNKLREIPILQRVIKVDDNFKNRYDDNKFTKAVRVSRGDDLSDEVGYRFCEPFIGKLPTYILSIISNIK